jgi:hypothetical protein
MTFCVAWAMAVDEQGEGVPKWICMLLEGQTLTAM